MCSNKIWGNLQDTGEREDKCLSGKRERRASAPAYICDDACDLMLAVPLGSTTICHLLYLIAHCIKGNIMFPYILIFTLGCKWQEKRFWSAGPNGSSHFENLICACFLMYAVLICLFKFQIFVILSHLQSLLILDQPFS